MSTTKITQRISIDGPMAHSVDGSADSVSLAKALNDFLQEGFYDLLNDAFEKFGAECAEEYGEDDPFYLIGDCLIGWND